jgi:hypothetical protein
LEAWKEKTSAGGDEDAADRVAALLWALRHRESNADTAMYHLLLCAERQEEG